MEHATRVLLISPDNVNDVIDYGAALCALCNNTAPGCVLPQEFQLYSSYCFQGRIWTDVKEGHLLLFVIFKGENAVALATLHWRTGGWESGFVASLPQHIKEYNQASLARYDFLQTAPNITVSARNTNQPF